MVQQTRKTQHVDVLHEPAVHMRHLAQPHRNDHLERTPARELHLAQLRNCRISVLCKQVGQRKEQSENARRGLCARQPRRERLEQGAENRMQLSARRHHERDQQRSQRHAPDALVKAQHTLDDSQHYIECARALLVAPRQQLIAALLT